MQATDTLRSCHQILGVARDASGEDVALAYLRLASAVHPALADGHADAAGRQARFREAAEAWSVLADGMAVRRANTDRDEHALAVYDETLGWHALTLAASGLGADAVLRVLIENGCPQRVAWPAAELAARLAGLGAKAKAIVRERPAAAEPGPATDPRARQGLDAGLSADERREALRRAALSARAKLERPPADGFPERHDVDASVEQRVAAAVADGLALLSFTVLPVVLVGQALGWGAGAIERLSLVAVLLGGFAYFVRAEAAHGATPGKRLLGLNVERVSGGDPDRGTAVARHALRTLSWCLFGIGFLTVAVTGRRQALHDLLTDTRVRWDGGGHEALVWPLCAAPVAIGVLGWVAMRLG